MNPGATGVATGEAEETAPKQQSLSEEILALMKGEELPAEQPTEEQHPEIPVETPEEIPQQPQEEDEVEDQTAAAPKGEAPPWALKRIAEETEKRKRHQGRADKAESERDHWMGVARRQDEQLREASLPRPTEADPLADVFDMSGLQKAERQYQIIKNVATRALDENQGQEIEVVVGKDKDNNPLTQTFTRERLSEMKLNAEYALNNLIPARGKLLAVREQADAIAAQVYPEFVENNGDNEWAGFVRETLKQYPLLAKVPDIAIWLGHALTGRRITLERLQKEYDKNGAKVTEESGLSAEARKILSQPKIKVSPAIATRRTPSHTLPRKGADVEAARKTMKARPGDDDAMAAFIDAKLFRGASRGYEKVA